MSRESIGAKIKVARRRLGMTQVVLAGLVNRSDRWLIDLERGATDPRIGELLDLAEALRVDVADLTGGSLTSEAASGVAGEERPRRPSVVAGSGLVVKDEQADLTYQPGRYQIRVRRELQNTGNAPVTRFLIRIAVDSYPDDADHSNKLYRGSPLTWEELDLKASCRGQAMEWSVKHDRDAFKELHLLFESPDGRRFPIYPGEVSDIEYSYTVAEAKWGQWFQRAIRWPTHRLGMRLDFPRSVAPALWGTETSLTAEAYPLPTPVTRDEVGDRVVFEWTVKDPPLHTRYRMEWRFGSAPPQIRPAMAGTDQA
ncbi:MAG TPA: helix-turn-helix transcriptional regulator [Candidatus Dormibacteraeota bacterium]|jgi:transcriptional regulator with XRE-family HTH domain|nr:helix-turn-helix transcriptional regulator [Candidatus Dormibacteraeota bacterium]